MDFLSHYVMFSVVHHTELKCCDRWLHYILYLKESRKIPIAGFGEILEVQ